ncbi:hypothetical protein PHMEG_0005808 [Phytophthora megakarya]|uniref:Uncharacterized protein n=1 Tax=Phytophthora megakarya TaxID=4795 RepID=A0A225WQL9_9STRA|nr:hypothetical protein PHMEG_0005808 [Phytophthora megakarya]
MRIFAKRMRSYAANLVHETPFGFVPGRDIHTAIHLV